MFCEDGSLGGDGPSRRTRQLVVGLRCDASYSRLYTEGLKRGGFELSGDETECSVFANIQLVQSGWGQPGLPGWGSAIDNTEVKGKKDLEKLVSPLSSPFGGRYGEYSTSVGNYCGDMRSKGKGSVGGNYEELRQGGCVERCSIQL